MTRKEFTEKSEAITRIFGWYLFVCLAAVLGGTTVQAFLPAVRTNPNFETVQNVVLWAFGMGGVCGMAALPFFLAKRWKVVCPTCNRTLIDQLGRNAQATGKCSKCQSNVFSEDAHVSGCRTSQWLTKNEFKSRIDEFGRKARRRGVILLFVFVGLTVAAGSISRRVQDAVERGAFDYFVPHEMVLFARGGLLLAILTLLGIPLLIAMSPVKGDGIPCPECRHPLTPRATRPAMDSGICIYCGCRLFEEPSSKNEGRNSL